jgi:CRISPR/Cas system-associated exonuclease Cas4 (RecB family)
MYTPGAKKPFALSRSKIDLFLECPRCFYLDRRLGIGRPKGFPFNLNKAVDVLLKKEFDIHRAKGEAHPLIKKYGVDAIPVAHAELDIWRENFKGVRFLHEETNFELTGAIDDLWQNSSGEYIVVDYKATSKDQKIETLGEDRQIGYKRQMEFYQWLLRRRGLTVSDTGYFVYCNGRKDAKAFDGKLEFDIALIAYRGDDSWVEKTIKKAHTCLNGKKIPVASKDCDYCRYIEAVNGKTNR